MTVRAGEWFGDAEPEDAWDPDDSVADLVGNIVARIKIIVGLRVLDETIEHRLDWIRLDLEHVAGRIAAGRLDRVN